MKRLSNLSNKLPLLGWFCLLFSPFSNADESQPEETAKKEVVEEAPPFSVESLDMDQLAETFGSKLSKWYFQYQEYPAAVAQLHLSDAQKVKLIAALRVCQASALSDEKRSYSISRLYEHWGQHKKALDELGTPEPSLHRARLLLKSGDRTAALAEGKRYFTASKVEGFQLSPFTGFPLTGLTHPYIAMEDFKGMEEYLNLLAELSPWRQDVRLAQLDLAYHLGTLDAYAAELKKMHPVRYIMYLQQVGRYADALEALAGHIERQPLSIPELVFLADKFNNHTLLQPAIQEMISSGEGSAETRKKLLSVIVQADSYRILEQMNLWMKTHPEELDRWANHFAYKMIPRDDLSIRCGQFLEDLHQKFPDNPVLAVCLARKLTVLHGAQAPGVTEILSRVVRKHLKAKSIDHARLPNWSKSSAWSQYSTNYFFSELDLTEPVAVALSMLRARMDAQTLLDLLHEAPEFSKLPLAQKARYFAIARLDRPFMETMLSFDWSRPENDGRAMWLRSYFNPFYFKDSIPVEYLDDLAGKLSTISMGSSEKFTTHRSYQELAPLLNLLLAKHPQPEKIKPAMLKLESAIKANPDIDVYLVFPSLRYLQRAYPSVRGIFELQKSAPGKKRLISKNGLNARQLRAVRIFSAPDIKRVYPLQDLRRSRMSYPYRYQTRNTAKYRGIDPLRYLIRRNRAYNQFLKPGKIEVVLRSTYPAFSEYALVYDLLQQLIQPNSNPEDIYQFLKTLDQSDPDLILFEAAVQAANKASNQEILKTLSRLQPAPVLHRNRAINFVQTYERKIRSNGQYSRSSSPTDNRKNSKEALVKSVIELMEIEPRVGLVDKPAKTRKDDSEKLSRSVGNQFVKFRDAKKYQSQECQALAKKVLWSLINGDEPTATVIHYQAMAAMDHIGGFDKFFIEVDEELKSRGMDELQRLKRLRRFYSYSSGKQKLKKLAYSRKIQALDPEDFIAANDLFPVYVSKGDGKWVIRCLRVIVRKSTEREIVKMLRQNSQIVPVLTTDQVAELLQILRMTPRNARNTLSEYLATFLPKCYEKNKQATLDYVVWLKKIDQDTFTVRLLNAMIDIGLRNEVVDVVSLRLFPGSESSKSAHAAVRFGRPQISVNSRQDSTDSELFSFMVGRGLAKEVLKGVVDPIDAIPISMVRNRFVLEMLVNPSMETYRRVSPHTVDRVSVAERTKMCVTLRAHLEAVSGSETLQLFLSQQMLGSSMQMSESEISRFFKLAYLAKDAEAVESTWNRVDTYIKEEQAKERESYFFARTNEYCLISTMLYGNDRRWQQLMKVYSENKRYKDEVENRRFAPQVLNNIRKVAELDVTNIPRRRGREMLQVAMQRTREHDRLTKAGSVHKHALQWVLFAAKMGDVKAQAYFYPKALQKVSERSSGADEARDELDFWIGVMNQDPAVMFPVVHAYRSDQQWNVLWSLSGVPNQKHEVGFACKYRASSSVAGGGKGDV